MKLHKRKAPSEVYRDNFAVPKRSSFGTSARCLTACVGWLCNPSKRNGLSQRFFEDVFLSSGFARRRGLNMDYEKSTNTHQWSRHNTHPREVDAHVGGCYFFPPGSNATSVTLFSSSTKSTAASPLDKVPSLG